MDIDALRRFSTKCRLCFQELITSHEKLNLGEIVREKFMEMTQFELSHSTKLSQFICYNCFSILSRYSALRKGFIENQNILNNLLKKTDNMDENDLYIKVEEIHEDKSKNESHGVIALRNLEDLYHVEEFDDKQSKNEPVVAEIANSSFFCDICSKCFNSQRTLKDHTNRIHLKFKNFSCDDCDYKSFSSYELIRHKIVKHNVADPAAKKFLCDLCAVEFSKSSSLLRHKRSHHLKITRYECDICGFKTYKKENLMKHIGTHLPASQKMLFKCSKCSAELTSPYILKMHEKNVHKQHQKDFHCSFVSCDKSFSREISLKEHIKYVHLKLRPISCDKCQMSFSSKSHLNRHEKRKHFSQFSD